MVNLRKKKWTMRGAMEEFADEQPAVLSFLLSDHEGALTDDERDFLLYLAVVIWRSVAEQGGMPPTLAVNQITEAEEANWATMEMAKGHTFRDRLDIFFQKTKQEDLLAFIEDSLMPGEPNKTDEKFPVTEEGAEPMFIMLKTVVDILVA